MINVMGGTKVRYSVLCYAVTDNRLGLVTRNENSSEGGLRLKTAAAMAENGEIRETIEKLLIGANADQAELASKVRIIF